MPGCNSLSQQLLSSTRQVQHLQYLEVMNSGSLLECPAIWPLVTKADQGATLAEGFPHAFQRLQQLLILDGVPLTSAQSNRLLQDLPALVHLAVPRVLSSAGVRYREGRPPMPAFDPHNPATYEPEPWHAGLLDGPGRSMDHIVVTEWDQTPSSLLALPLQITSSFSWRGAPQVGPTTARLVLSRQSDIALTATLAQTVGACAGSVAICPHPQYGNSLLVDCSTVAIWGIKMTLSHAFTVLLANTNGDEVPLAAGTAAATSSRHASSVPQAGSVPSNERVQYSDATTAAVVAALAPMAPKLQGLILKGFTLGEQTVAALRSGGWGEHLRGLRLVGCKGVTSTRAALECALPNLLPWHFNVQRTNGAADEHWPFASQDVVQQQYRDYLQYGFHWQVCECYECVSMRRHGARRVLPMMMGMGMGLPMVMGEGGLDPCAIM